MRAGRWGGILLAGGLVAATSGAGQDAGLVLLDAPRGAWLGEIRAGAPVEVIEERDGWRRVRIEGWVRSSPAAAAAAPAPHAAPSGAAAAVGITGLLSPRPGMQPATAGGGLVVLLLTDPETTDAAHHALGEPCRAGLQAMDRKLEDLAKEGQGALNSSSNFKEAAQRSDRAKAAVAAAQRDRAARLQQCREQAEAFFSERAVTRTVADAAGRFELRPVEPGRYRVVAMERTAAATRAWSMSADVTGGGVALEGRAANGPDPYWDLR
jgi:hypothetical protein